MTFNPLCIAGKAAFFNPRPHTGREGGDATPLRVFSEMVRRIALKFCTAYVASFAQLLAKKLTGSGQVTEL